MRIIIYCVLGLIAVLGATGGAIALIGSRLPQSHRATRSVLIHQLPQTVYELVRDFGAAPSWRPDLKRVEVRQESDGRVHFREEGKNGIVNYELVEERSDSRLVTRIVDTDLGYSGQWTYEFAPAAGGTRVTITEDGEVPNVLFRFMSRYVFGHTATIDSCLTALARRFDENATPQ